jgi:6-phosphogluconolactonase
MRFNLHKNSVALAIILLGLTLGLAACKLTSNGGFSTPPPTQNTEYLFATSNNQVWSFSVNATTGALSAGASITGAGFSPALVGSPGGKFLYVTDAVNDQVDVYAISSSGTLSKITGSPYSMGGTGGVYTPAGLAMDSAGKFLYASDPSDNAVAGFTVNSTTGALATASSSPFTAGGEPAQLVVDASGKFAYAADFSSVQGGVSAFTLDSGSGALTPVAGFSPFNIVLNGAPLGVATTGQFVYVTEQNANAVFAMSITGGTGGLITIGTRTATGVEPTGVVVTPSAKYLYVANYGDSTISGYSVNSSTGALTSLGTPFAATAAAYYLAVDPSGSFLYATNPNGNTISGFTINSSTGALTQFSGSATAAGTQPVALTVVTVP